jgi:hypothetical protein
MGRPSLEFVLQAQNVHSVLRTARGNVTERIEERKGGLGNRGRKIRKTCVKRGRLEKRDLTGRGSALVTNGALLGIKSVGSDAEHVIALDADAVDDGTDDGTGLGGLG